MLFQLAWRNVRKSYKDFTIYFITLTFSICLFYSFNTFQDQRIIFDMTNTKSQLFLQINSIMQVLSFFVLFVLFFLILYANTFLIKRRKKELAIYMLEGMDNRDISLVLMMETMMVGLLSLMIGIGIGVLFSQLLMIFTSQLFELSMENYQFIFSNTACLFTIVCFLVIFIAVIICNVYLLGRYKLIDLLYAEKKNPINRIRSIHVSVLLFIVSILMLGIAYYLALARNLMFLSIPMFFGIIALGTAGTILFFFSLAGFLLRFIQTSTSIYYRHLHMFSLRQLNNNINSNFLSMSLVCLMLLMSIGALSTGFSLMEDINDKVSVNSPVDMTLISGNSTVNAKYSVDILFGGIENIASKYTYIDTVQRTDISKSILSSILPSDDDMNGPLLFVKQSQYEQYLQMQKDTSIPASSPVLYFTNKEEYEAAKQALEHAPIILDIDGVSHSISDVFLGDFINNIDLSSKRVYLILPDEVVHPWIERYYAILDMPSEEQPDFNERVFQLNSYADIYYKEGINQSYFDDNVGNLILEKNEALHEDEAYATVSYQSKEDVQAANVSLTAIFTFSGIYLGIIFLISASVLLALQQLSGSYDNVQRYRVLQRIGASQKMINHSMLLQVSLYFLLPLFLAIIHAIIGIQVVAKTVETIRDVNILNGSFLVAGILIVIYGGYYLITYFGYKNILK